MATSRIKVELELNDSGFVERTRVAGKTVRTLGVNLDRTANSVRRMERHVTSFSGKMRDFVTITGLARHALVNMRAVVWDWQQQIIDANATLERMGKLLEGMSEAATASERVKEAGENLQWLITKAQEAPFSLNELGNTFVKFRSVGIDPTNGSMQALLDSVARFGGNDQILHRATIAIQQMAGKGVISMEELRQQLGEAVPRAIQLLARSMNMTFRELVNAISKGTVESMSALEKMFGEFRRNYEGAAFELMSTWIGMTQQMRTQWMVFLNDVGQAGFFDAAKQEFQSLINAFADGQFKSVAENIGQALAAMVRGLRSFIDFLVNNWDAIKVFGKALATAFAINTLLNFSRALRASVVPAIAASSMAMKKFAVDVSVAMFAIRTAPTALSATTAAIGAFTFAIRGLVSALGLVAPILIAFTTLFYALDSAAKTAEETISEMDLNFVSSQDVVTAKQALNEIEGEYNRVLTRIEKAERDGTAKSQDDMRKLADLRSKYLNARIKFAQIEEAFSRQVTTREKRNARQAMSEQLVEAKNAYQTTAAIQDEFLRRKEITNEQHKTNMINIARTMYAKMGEAYLSEMKETEAALETARKQGAEDSIKKLEARLSVEREMYLEHREQSARELKAMELANVFITDSAGEEKKANKLETYLNSLANKAIDAKAELAGMNGELAKFQFMLESGQFGKAGVQLLGDPKAWDKAKEKVLEAENSYKAAIEARRQATQITQLVDSTQKSNEAGLQKMLQMRRQLESGYNNETAVEARIRGLIEWLDALVAKSPAAEAAIAELRSELQEGLTIEQDRKALQDAFNFKERARLIRQGLLTEREMRRAEYEYEKELLEQRLLDFEGDSEAQVAMQRELYGLLDALRDQYMRDTETAIQALNRDWQDITDEMEQAWVDFANNATDAIMDFVETGKFEFADLITSMLRELIRLQIQKNIVGPLTSALSSAVSGMFGASDFGGSFIGSSSLGGGPTPVFADGGIMTPAGKLPLRSYASGGIADSPQLALFGEGRMNEAYVPLPDGKNIPVTLTGQQVPNVQVNVINQSGQPVKANQGQTKFDGRQMILDVVLEAANRPGGFRDGLRGAVR